MFGRLSLSLLAGVCAATAAASESRAEQFVLFDVTFSFTKMQADTSTPSKSHYYVRGPMLNASRPTNWTSPVDYRNGTVHIRTEVLEKPEGGAVNTWTLCYIPNRGIGAGYGCTGTGNFREKGVYDKDESMTSWWQNTAIDWSQGIRQMDLVFKDGSGGSGFAHLRPDPEKYFPTKLRITMIQVSAGSKYDPSLVPNLAPSADGGVSPPVADAGAADVRGTGGSSGGNASGGTSGGSGSGGRSGDPTPGTGGTTAPAEGGSSGSTGTGGSTGGGSANSGGSSGGNSGSGGSSGGVRPNGNTAGGSAVSGGCAVAMGTTSGAAGLTVAFFGLLMALAARRRRR
ncbi:MAG TPA: hypothetical protein VGF45_02750 [Polyangia bacterium]